MNKTTRALKIADSAIALAKISTNRSDDIRMYDEALAAIREALAEQDKQEPVAFALSHSLGLEFSSNYPMCKSKERAEELARQHMGQVVVTPLYAAPVSEPEQEPVAWMWQSVDIESRSIETGLLFNRGDDDENTDWTPLYAAPVSAEAIRAEALEEAAQECDKWASVKPFSDFSSGSAAGAQNCAAAIRSLK